MALLLAAATPAGAQTAGSAPVGPNSLRVPSTLERAPLGHRLTGRQALAIANADPQVVAERAKHRRTVPTAYLKGRTRWQVSYFTPRPERKEVAQVIVDDATGAVLESWTGFKVAWTMARGYEGAFGRKSNSLYVWVPLCLLFVVPFVDPRRLRRWLHLDLLAIVSLSASLALFNHGEIVWSVPLAYPPLVYLLARMLWLGRRRLADAEPLRLLVPASWLALAVIFLLGFRIGLNVTNSNVIDVGYAGVIGADKIADGEPLYGGFPSNNQHGDTYGPVNYLAYVPFEQLAPWGGRWDDLPAAHLAAIAFDVLAVLLLWLLGRRLRGPPLGVVLAYAWVACPWTLFVLTTNANDALVGALVLAPLLALARGRPLGAGAGTALAGLTKFAPLALGPLFARAASDGPRPARRIVVFGLGFLVLAAAVALPALLDASPREIWDRTLGFQADRGSPFSVWGYRGDLDALQTAVQIGAVALAVAVAVLPRGPLDVPRVAALGAAVVIALQLGVTHWFYLYVVWFLPLLLVALLARHREPAPAT